MASFYPDEEGLKEIRRIVIDTPYESDGSIQSWEDISDEDMSDSSEDENAEDEDFSVDSGQNLQLPSTFGNRVPVAVRRRAQRRQTVPEINWGDLDEVAVVDYLEFLGPKHGPVKVFPLDSEPVVFFDKLFTDELWDLMVTETNRYARQANVNNWQDTTGMK